MDAANFFTEYDKKMQTKELQMIKTMLPYMPNSKKGQIQTLIIFLQMQQFMKTMEEEKSPLAALEKKSFTESRLEMIDAIKPYCNEKEMETLDNICTLFHIMESYDAMLH